MTGRTTLARQLSIAMVALAVATTVTSTLAFYLVYDLLGRWRIVELPSDGSDTTGWDIGITLGLCLLGLLLAPIMALRLARRIVQPLDAVGAAARQIAGGSLDTRAKLSDGAYGETALLVADFNAMASRLQRMAEDVTIWNAQIAHELRTPLTVLKGRLQGAKDGVFNFDTELVDGLLTQVEGLSRLVDDLRSVSLADSGRLELALTAVDLAAELDDIAPELRSMLEPAGFRLRLEATHGQVIVDVVRIRQAILALVDNALCHADPCEIVITTTLNKETAVIMVADHGPGLAVAFEEDAFRLFVRGVDAGTRSSSGSGLGLAIVRGIAHAHGGDVRFERTPGTAAFAITLPRAGVPVGQSG